MGQLWDVWSVWWSGRSAGGMPLWGMTVLWWGRVGKLMQFSAGLTVILDLVGPDRLRHMGRAFEEKANVVDRLMDKVSSVHEPSPDTRTIWVLWGGLVSGVIAFFWVVDVPRVARKNLLILTILAWVVGIFTSFVVGAVLFAVVIWAAGLV